MVAGVSPCANDQATVTVTENQAPNAGTDGALTVCDQGGATALFTQLTGADAGGTWTDPSGAAHSGSYAPATNGPGVYTYTVNAAAPCVADQAVVTVNEVTTPVAGPDGSVTLCSTDAPVDLSTLLVGADAGGTWTAPGGAAHASTVDPATDASGAYTYTIAAATPCPGDLAQITVTINTPPDAGADGLLSVCDQGGAASLFNQLAGADPGGTWTAPGGAAHGASYDPAVDVPGVFTYTVAGTAPCPADQATVTVSETSTPNAGADGTITLCATDASVDLFTLLTGADGGGTWAAPGGAAHSNTLDPASDASGVYTYTIAAVAPCTGDQAQVTVTINNPPNAGTDGVLTVCDQGGATAMFPQLTGADAGGTWTAPGGAAHGANYDPASDAPGVFTYTVAGTAPCPADQATVTVSETSTPNAGVDGTITLCSTDATVDLFTLLTGADGGGSWSAPGGAAHSNTLDPATDGSGVYTYTIAAVAPCNGDQAQVAVTINNPPNAGADGVLTVCDQGGATAMFPQLTGADGGGSWTAPGGAAHGANYDPTVDAPGVFTYTVAGTTPCPADQATVTVSETSTPNAGVDGTITLCATDASVDLFTLLTGADGGGTWAAPGGAAHSNTLDPATDGSGVYTYTIPAIAPCTGDQAQVTVTINNPPNAGADGVLTVCDQGGATAMFPQLTGADGGGTWTAPGGAAHGASYDPAVDAPGVFTYTVAGTAPCPADQATVTVSETSTPNAGADGTITLCSTDASADLFTLLTGADGGGTWAAPGGAAHSNTLDPATDASGVYTYTIVAVAPCTGDQAQVTVTINNPPNAGADGVLTVCDQGGATAMFPQLTGADGGGTWTAPGGAAHGANYDPTVDAPGVFTYTVAGTTPCPADQATVTVSETSTPNAGADGTITLCATDASVDLFTLLTGADGGGTWAAPGGAAHSNTLDPATDGSGVYTYTIAAVAPCTGDQAQVTVTINNPPNAGTDGVLTVCDQGGATAMFPQLTGADAGGTWAAPGGAAHSDSYDPATDAPGVFTYTVAGTASCAADQATVTVSETSSPNAGSDGTITICASDASLDLFTLLTGADGGGTWTAPGGAVHSSTLDPATDGSGVYTYTIAAVAPCTGDQAQVTVTINNPPDAGADGVLTVCDQGSATDMFAQLTGSDGGGTWTDASGAAHSDSYDPAIDAPGVFTYTVAGTAPCPADQATVTVSETSSPNAGSDGAITLCASDASVDLFTLLTGADGGGSWAAPGGAPHSNTLDPATDGTGVYTYTIAAVAPCTGDQTQVTVTIN
ncbi:MAG TPA: hypothetical protein VHL57_08425, partial [Flavobacteriales bacterium]|nr:hypothetical protein [Flavobacteriales bacterium]